MNEAQALAIAKQAYPWAFTGRVRYSSEFRQFVHRGVQLGTVDDLVLKCVCINGDWAVPAEARVSRAEFDVPAAGSLFSSDYCLKVYLITSGVGTIGVRTDALFYPVITLNSGLPWRGAVPLIERVWASSPDSCPTCNVVGYRHRMACICPSCHRVIWGC